VRSVHGVDLEVLRAAMQRLKLNKASSKMSPDVSFLLAIPILEPCERKRFTCPVPIAGVVYIDSTAGEFFVDDELLKDVVFVIREFIIGLERETPHLPNRVVNVPLTGLCNDIPPAELLPQEVSGALQLVADIDPPQTNEAFQFNFEYSDFISVKS
jgi:hypothetical protein